MVRMLNEQHGSWKALAIRDAILSGERNTAVLASLSDPCVKSSAETIEHALEVTIDPRFGATRYRATSSWLLCGSESWTGACYN
jgi:hypothetical protein